MANFEGLKNYCRVDDDDITLQIYLFAAIEYVQNAGIPKQRDNSLYDLLVYMIAYNWYSNRGLATTDRMNDIPMGATNILLQLREGLA